MTQMKIAVFNYGLPAPGRKRGGVDKVAHDLADGLARRGHQVIVWATDTKPEGAAYEVRPLPGSRFIRTRLGRILSGGYLGNIFAALPDYGGCDVLLAHGDSLLLPLLRKPLIRIMYGSALGEALSASTPWRFLLQMGAYPLELLSSLTQPNTVAISRNTLRYNPFVHQMIPLGVDLRLLHPDDLAKTVEPSIVFVGTLNGRKRGGLLLEWFQREIRTRFPDATLHMVTLPGPKAGGVSYYSGISSAELAALYRRSWIYASPSRYEGFGLPYLEAMASGTPVIASDNPGSREVLDGGKYGLIAPDKEFSTAILRLITSEKERREMKERGLQRAREYSLDTFIDRYEALLVTIVASPAQRRLELS